MATAPRARGSRFKLYGLTESTYGTAATGNYNQLPCFSFALGGVQPVKADNVLSGSTSRDSTDPMQDMLTVTGNAVVPVDLESFGHWLFLLFGAATDSGTTDYTHTWESGVAALPSKSFEKAFTDSGAYFDNLGVKANTLALSFAPTGAAQATIGLIGQSETYSGASGAGTPTFAGMTRFHQHQGTISVGGSALANVVSATLNYTNTLEGVQTIRSDLKIAGVDEGVAAVSGKITCRFTDTTLIADADAFSAVSLALGYTIASNKSLTFTMPRTFLDRNSPPVTGPGGIQVDYNFYSAFDSASGHMMETVLKNQTATYA